MRFSIVTILAIATAVSAAALPDTLNAACKCEPTATSKSGGYPTKGPAPTKGPEPTGGNGGGKGGKPTSTWGQSSPTGVPGCAGSKVNCQSGGFLNALNCFNLLNGNSVAVPISIFRDVELEERNGQPQPGDYCCSSAGFLNAGNCVNILDGNSISIPINIL